MPHAPHPLHHLHARHSLSYRHIVSLCATLDSVIRSFKHAGLERFFLTGSVAGIQPAHARKLQSQLFALNEAADHQKMNVPGWHLHPLKGNLEGHWSVRVNGNWRMTFRFEVGDAILVDYRDYH
jgi:toxin HigB-1